jgi:hypothetical protein
MSTGLSPGSYDAAVEVLGIEVEASLVRRWAAWLAPGSALSAKDSYRAGACQSRRRLALGFFRGPQRANPQRNFRQREQRKLLGRRNRNVLLRHRDGGDRCPGSRRRTFRILVSKNGQSHFTDPLDDARGSTPSEVATY